MVFGDIFQNYLDMRCSSICHVGSHNLPRVGVPGQRCNPGNIQNLKMPSWASWRQKFRFKNPCYNELKFRIQTLRRHLQQHGHNRIYHGFAWSRAKPRKFIIRGLFAYQSSNIRESKMPSTVDRMPSGRCLLKMIDIDPGE